MLDDYGFEIYEENEFPIAYLLTFRTFGTWLHGDARGSNQRSRDSRFGTIKIDPNVPLNETMADEIEQQSVILDSNQRNLVESAITEVCEFRAYELRALNVRTNHTHAVVSKAIKPERIVNDFKAYSTRKLRGKSQFSSGQKIWSRGASMRYLWKPRHVEAAVDYVLYCQEDVPFDFKS